MESIARQAVRYAPKLISVRSPADAARLKGLVPPGIEVVSGAEGLVAVATHPDADMLLSALVGAVGLVPTMRALEMGRDVAVANKETLVMAGEAIMGAAKKSGARTLPVDSEHSAIFQALGGRGVENVKRIVLTASGGPFRGRKAADLYDVEPEKALRHPKWSMGPKITIDSATLMNKGLEVIEARWLFGLLPDKISVTVHPQSIVHSLVEFVDGSMLAQMGVPDMRGPIGYALAYPDRLPMDDEMALDLWGMGELTFEPPDLDAFPCLGLAYEALKAGGTAPAVLSGANEVAVEAYLARKIKFGEIPALLGDALETHAVRPAVDVEAALAADREARAFADGWVKKRS